MVAKKISAKQKRINSNCKLFLATLYDVDDNGKEYTTTPKQHYAKLKKAKKEGRGNRLASEYAEVAKGF